MGLCVGCEPSAFILHRDTATASDQLAKHPGAPADENTSPKRAGGENVGRSYRDAVDDYKLSLWNGYPRRLVRPPDPNIENVAVRCDGLHVHFSSDESKRWLGRAVEHIGS